MVISLASNNKVFMRTILRGNCRIICLMIVLVMMPWPIRPPMMNLNPDSYCVFGVLSYSPSIITVATATDAGTEFPTSIPTTAPSGTPTAAPTEIPSASPTVAPTVVGPTPNTLASTDLEMWRQIYDALDGDQWVNCGNRDDPCGCDFGEQRVVCNVPESRRQLQSNENDDDEGDADGTLRIREIVLRSNRLKGALPASALNGLFRILLIDFRPSSSSSSSSDGNENELLLPEDKAYISEIEVDGGDEACAKVEICYFSLVSCHFGQLNLCEDPLLAEGDTEYEDDDVVGSDGNVNATIIGGAIGGSALALGIVFGGAFYATTKRTHKPKRKRKRRKLETSSRHEQEEYDIYHDDTGDQFAAASQSPWSSPSPWPGPSGTTNMRGPMPAPPTPTPTPPMSWQMSNGRPPQRAHPTGMHQQLPPDRARMMPQQQMSGYNNRIPAAPSQYYYHYPASATGSGTGPFSSSGAGSRKSSGPGSRTSSSDRKTPKTGFKTQPKGKNKGKGTLGKKYRPQLLSSPGSLEGFASASDMQARNHMRQPPPRRPPPRQAYPGWQPDYFVNPVTGEVSWT